MQMLRTLPLCLGLLGCTAAAPAEDPNVVIVNSINFVLTGNDGAAFGQVGFGEVSEDGDIYCALNSPARPDGTRPPRQTYRGSDPSLFPALRALVLQNGEPVADIDDTLDQVTLSEASGAIIAIRPGAAFDGHASELGLALLALLNAQGRPCLPFG